MSKSPAALTSTTFWASSKVKCGHILEYANSATTTKHKLQAEAEGRKNKASTEMYRKVEED